MIVYCDTTSYPSGETTVAYASSESTETAWEPAEGETVYEIAGSNEAANMEDEESEILNSFVAMVVPPAADREDVPEEPALALPVFFPSGFV